MQMESAYPSLTSAMDSKTVLMEAMSLPMFAVCSSTHHSFRFQNRCFQCLCKVQRSKNDLEIMRILTLDVITCHV